MKLLLHSDSTFIKPNLNFWDKNKSFLFSPFSFEGEWHLLASWKTIKQITMKLNEVVTSFWFYKLQISTSVNLVKKKSFLFSPSSWFEGEWSPCSTSCGVGQQVRLVYCEQVMHGVRAEIIDDSFCQTGSLGDKPEYQQECMTAICPEWKSGNWSQVGRRGKSLNYNINSCLLW